MDLSIIVPIYNEEESVRPLYSAIVAAMSKTVLSYEIIFVDDGSSDNTYKELEKISSEDERLKIVKLKRNYGQTIGLYAGFKNATGEKLVTMDGDLQNDPDDIPNMLAKLDEGFDIVLGWRYNRKDKIISRKIPSKMANWLISKVTGVPVKDNGCAIRAYRAEIIHDFPMYSEMHRLLPVTTALAGARFAQVKVKHHPRKFGSSKYGLSRIYKVLLDLVALKTIFSSFYHPLFGFGYFAVGFGIISFLSFILTIIRSVTVPEQQIVILTGVSFLFFALSLFFIFLGIICHLIYKSGKIQIEKMYFFKYKEAKTGA